MKTSATRILVIEDNETNRSLMTYLLRAFGYAALEAVDGESGVEIARREQLELIVCDVHLPKLDGYGVVRQLKGDEAVRKIPIIAVTALAMVGDRDRMLAAGFDGYLSKPIAPETFVTDIEKFLAPKLRSRVRPTTARAAPSQVKLAREANDGGRRIILAVDDISENLEFVRSTLKPSGYTVITTNNVESAVALTREKKPDLLLCDLHMKPHNGLDLLARAKSESALRAIPIVIISSTGTGSHNRAECLKCGAANFIQRPIEPEALLTEIAKTLSEKKQK